MKLPTIHLNGTSSEELVQQACDAANAISVALTALSQAWPNGRDYYPQGNTALREAEAEWESRRQRLQSVYNELMEFVTSIQDRG